MDKRHFLLTAAAGAAWPLQAAHAQSQPTCPAVPGAAGAQPAVLTLSGRIGRSNRGASDGVSDQLMKRHGVAFSEAYAFTAADLARLPVERITTTVEYDQRRHELRGPAMAEVLRAAAVDLQAPLTLQMRAVDGYSPRIPLALALRRRMIVATHLDGQPLGFGGLGLQWAVFDADAQPGLQDKPLSERFQLCPWGLYLIELVA